MRARYVLLCTLLGLVLGWIPFFLHGPIPEKYSILRIDGPVAVWGWYTARMLIGFHVGVVAWPRAWYLRGPLCGLLVLFPLTIVSLATPGCGLPCMQWNLLSAATIGLAVAGLAKAITGLDHAGDAAPASPAA